MSFIQNPFTLKLQMV